MTFCSIWTPAEQLSMAPQVLCCELVGLIRLCTPVLIYRVLSLLSKTPPHQGASTSVARSFPGRNRRILGREVEVHLSSAIGHTWYIRPLKCQRMYKSLLSFAIIHTVKASQLRMTSRITIKPSQIEPGRSISSEPAAGAGECRKDTKSVLIRQRHPLPSTALMVTLLVTRSSQLDGLRNIHQGCRCGARCDGTPFISNLSP
jgi:hypothetical protein